MSAPPPGKPAAESRQAVKTHHRPRGYIANYRPRAETQALLAEVELVLEEYQDDWPLTVRQIFYRLVGAYGHAKTAAFYERLCDHLSNARRGRLIPFEAIRDDGVSVMAPAHYANEDEFHATVADMAGRYRQDKLASQQVQLEVWCEAAGMMPQLARVAHEYSVPVYSSSGFDSTTAKYSLAQRIWRLWKGTVVLHLGDFDPSGEALFAAVSEDVRAFVLEDRLTAAVDVEFERVALTPNQIERFDLPRDDVKESSHSPTWAWDYSCQLEALPPDVVAAELRAAIERRFDLDRWRQDRRAEYVTRQHLRYALPAAGESST